MALRVREFALADLQAEDLGKWQALAERSLESNAWLDPRFLATAASWTAATASLRLLIVEDAEAWLAVLAFATERPMRRVPINVSTTATPFLVTHADRHAPLIAADRVDDAAPALLRTVVGRKGIAQLRGLPADGPLAGAVQTTAREDKLGVHETRRYSTTLASRSTAELVEAGGLELDLAHLDSGRRNKITRRARQLARELGAPLEVVDVAADADLFERFVAFQSSGWKGDPLLGGGALALNRNHRDWIQSAVSAFQRDGDLLAYELRCADTVLYSSLNVRSARGAFLILDAYEERFANRGPGTIGRVASWQAALMRPDVNTFDGGIDPQQSEASSLYPGSVERVDLTIVGRGLASRGRYRALELARRLRERS